MLAPGSISGPVAFALGAAPRFGPVAFRVRRDAELRRRAAARDPHAPRPDDCDDRAPRAPPKPLPPDGPPPPVVKLRAARQSGSGGYLVKLRQRAAVGANLGPLHVVSGNITGLKPSQKHALERVYRRRLRPGEVASAELAAYLCGISREIERQVGILVGRRGEIEHVFVGDASRINLPEIGRIRAGRGRFRGLRLVHTHLRNEPLTRDDLVDLALLRLDLVAAIGVWPDGRPGRSARRAPAAAGRGRAALARAADRAVLPQHAGSGRADRRA